MFKNPFSFDGRIRRLEYALSYLVVIIVVSIMVLILDATDSITREGNGGIIMLLIYIPMMWFSFAQGAKRCDDKGNNGWWQIIPFYWMWMLFVDGEMGDNEYGPNPKGESYRRGMIVNFFYPRKLSTAFSIRQNNNQFQDGTPHVEMHNLVSMVIFEGMIIRPQRKILTLNKSHRCSLF